VRSDSRAEVGARKNAMMNDNLNVCPCLVVCMLYCFLFLAALGVLARDGFMLYRPFDVIYHKSEILL